MPVARRTLLADIQRLAKIALIGSISETYRTCGNPGCRCRRGGPKHGPHTYVSYRGDAGKTTAYYVPVSAQPAVKEGIDAWRELQDRLRELAKLNKDAALSPAPSVRRAKKR